MATTSMSAQTDAVYSAHVLDRVLSYVQALTRAVRIETAAMDIKAAARHLGIEAGPVGERAYEAYRRVSARYADDALKAAIDLKDALDVTDEDWLEAWLAAGKRRKALVEQFSKLGHEFLLSRQKASGPPSDPAAIKASAHELLLSGFGVIRAIMKEAR